jgi:hypothetical protein
VGVFEYSHEPGTVAGTMENDPEARGPAEVKAAPPQRGDGAAAEDRFERSRDRAKFDEKNPTRGRPEASMC